MPAKKPTRWMAPALPVFAGEPAPTTACACVGAGLPANTVAAATVSGRWKMASRAGPFAGKHAPTGDREGFSTVERPRAVSPAKRPVQAIQTFPPRDFLQCPQSPTSWYPHNHNTRPDHPCTLNAPPCTMNCTPVRHSISTARRMSSTWPCSVAMLPVQHCYNAAALMFRTPVPHKASLTWMATRSNGSGTPSSSR